MGDEMTIEEAMKTAIEYEIRIRDIYLEAVAAVDGKAGKRIFETLAKTPWNSRSGFILWPPDIRLKISRKPCQ